jgi:predicted DsbA family dithiol-disulfide isomerase
MPATVEVYADFICPWCYIGLDRLNRLVKDRAVLLHWNPYLLRPDIPRGGVPLSSVLPPGRLERAEAAVLEATQAAGLPLNRPDMMPNTRKAHEIGMLAEAKGLGDVYHRAVFNAYFVQARNIGDEQVLADIAEEAGLAREEVLGVIHSGRYRTEVGLATTEAFQRGIRSVPNFIFPSGKGFSGAQPYEAFLNAMDSAGQTQT